MSIVLAVVRRILSMLVPLIGVSVIIFIVLRLLPGNAVQASLGVSEGLLTHAQIAALDKYYGVGQPAFQHTSPAPRHPDRQPRGESRLSFRSAP